MKTVSFQSSTELFQSAIELSFFFMMSDVTYFTVICYEDGKFQIINTMVYCVLLSCLSILMISDLTYYTVICYEACKFPVIDTLVSCAFELSFLFMMSDVTYFTVICYEAGKFPVMNTMVSVCH